MQCVNGNDIREIVISLRDKYLMTELKTTYLCKCVQSKVTKNAENMFANSNSSSLCQF
jgi:hypothetical protein